jgi:methylated-DNA-protein-cysteine methyltransferase-like protein
MRGFKEKGKNGGFRARVYGIVALIPAGRVATYGQIAAYLGNPLAARAVGEAMRNAPGYLALPCHRVVNRQGGLSPAYAFGGMQRALLEREGVPFRDNGTIDLKKCLWIKGDTQDR